MNQVGAKVPILASSLTLSELTPASDYFRNSHAIITAAREQAIEGFLTGKRKVPKLSDHSSEEQFFISVLKQERELQIKEAKELIYKLTANNGCALEALRVINKPGDPSPSPDGKRRSSQEATLWRASRVVVSKISVMAYIAHMTGEHIEGPEHAASKQTVQEWLPPNYISVYSDNLTEDEKVKVGVARPPDTLAAEFMINREAELNSDIERYELNDTLAVIKGKLKNLPLAEKSFQDSLARHNANLSSNIKQEGIILAFINDRVPIASSLCEYKLIAYDFAGIWSDVEQHFVGACSHHLDGDEKEQFPPFDPSKENIQGFRKRLSHYLAHLQCLSQRLHLANREKAQLDYQTVLAEVLLSDSEWSTKHHGPTASIKEVKDAHVRGMIKTAFKNDKIYIECIFDVMRLDSDANAMQLINALIKEEKLQGRSGLQTAASVVAVNAVQSPSTDSSVKSCSLHGHGNHDDTECRLLKDGKVVWDAPKKAYVYKDSGEAYKRKAPASEAGKSNKKAKHEAKPPGKGDFKKKEKDHQVPRDKEKKKEKEKEKKKFKKINVAIEGLKTTMVNMVQSQSSSSSAAPAAPAPAAPAAPSQDVNALLEKQFGMLKKSLGIEDP